MKNKNAWLFHFRWTEFNEILFKLTIIIGNVPQKISAQFFKNNNIKKVKSSRDRQHSSLIFLENTNELDRWICQNRLSEKIKDCLKISK